MPIGRQSVELDFLIRTVFRNSCFLLSVNVVLRRAKKKTPLQKRCGPKELNLLNIRIFDAHCCQELIQMKLKNFILFTFFSESYGNFKDKFISFSFDKEEFLFLGKVQVKALFV